MGSIDTLASGRYRARFRDAYGRSRSKTFRRKQDASHFLRTVGADVLRGAYVDPRLGRLRFADWASQWMETTAHLRPGTRARYRSVIENHLLPVFGAAELAKVTPLEIRQWVARMGATLPPSAVRRNYVLMAMAMKAAVEAELIVKSPCTAKAPRLEVRPMRFLIVEEVGDLADAIHPHYRTLVFVLAYGGLRWAEAAGLRRRYVDTMRRTIRVEEQLGEVDGAQPVPGQPPKTRAGVRTVTIPAFLAAMLDDHFAGLEKQRAELGLGPLGSDDFVFVNTKGGLLRRSGFRLNHWLPAVRKGGLEGLRVHDLRHTAVAFAINLSNAHPKAVQVRFGHSSIQVTYDRYGHLFPQMDEDIAEHLDAAFRAAQEGGNCQARILTMVPNESETTSAD